MVSECGDGSDEWSGWIGGGSVNGRGIEWVLQVTNCWSLKSIEIGAGGVLNERGLMLKGLNRLESIPYDCG